MAARLRNVSTASLLISAASWLVRITADPKISPFQVNGMPYTAPKRAYSSILQQISSGICPNTAAARPPGIVSMLPSSMMERIACGRASVIPRRFAPRICITPASRASSPTTARVVRVPLRISAGTDDNRRAGNKGVEMPADDGIDIGIRGQSDKFGCRFREDRCVPPALLQFGFDQFLSGDPAQVDEPYHIGGFIHGDSGARVPRPGPNRSGSGSGI